MLFAAKSVLMTITVESGLHHMTLGWASTGQKAFGWIFSSVDDLPHVESVEPAEESILGLLQSPENVVRSSGVRSSNKDLCDDG